MLKYPTFLIPALALAAALTPLPGRADSFVPPDPFRIGEAALDRVSSPPSVYLDSLPAATAPTAAPGDSTPASFPVILTLYYLNDGDSVRPGGTDRHYTAAVAISLACQCPLARDVGGYVPSFYNQLDPAQDNTTFALGLITGLDIYTPQDYYSRVNPDPTDWPYAGWLYGGAYLQRARTDIPSTYCGTYGLFEHIELDLGTVGPASQAGHAQIFVHHTLGYQPPLGWDSQVHDEFGFNLIYQRRYRFTLLDGADCGLPKDYAVQLIPHAGFTVGTIDRFCNAGATLRAGWQLPDDFGPTLIHVPPAATGNQHHAYFGVYGFLRVEGKLVQYDTTLEGNNFRNSPGVDAYPAVGSFTPGLAVQLFRHMEIVYSQTFLTKEYVGQPTADAYGTLAINIFWSF